MELRCERHHQIPTASGTACANEGWCYTRAPRLFPEMVLRLASVAEKIYELGDLQNWYLHTATATQMTLQECWH